MFVTFLVGILSIKRLVFLFSNSFLHSLDLHHTHLYFSKLFLLCSALLMMVQFSRVLLVGLLFLLQFCGYANANLTRTSAPVQYSSTDPPPSPDAEWNLTTSSVDNDLIYAELCCSTYGIAIIALAAWIAVSNIFASVVIFRLYHRLRNHDANGEDSEAAASPKTLETPAAAEQGDDNTEKTSSSETTKKPNAEGGNQKKASETRSKSKSGKGGKASEKRSKSKERGKTTKAAAPPDSMWSVRDANQQQKPKVDAEAVPMMPAEDGTAATNTGGSQNYGML